MSLTPVRPTDEDARQLAQDLLASARHAALSVIDPQIAAPFVSRVGVGLGADGLLVSLISDLAMHTRALRADPACALLLGEPGEKGDPLSHPRLTLQARAVFVARGSDAHEKMAAHYLRDHPKAKLYLTLGDFGFVRFDPVRAFLNGGFGRAYNLTPADLLPSATA